MNRRVLITAAVITAALSVAPASSVQAGAFPGRNGKIVYIRDTGATESVSVINRDGSGRRNYATKDANTEFPDASASGKTIVFDRYTPTNDYDIFRMSSTGKGVRNLTKNAANDWGPSISPDGQWVAFASDRGGNMDIWVMTIDGKKLHPIVETIDYDSEPAWSPNGKRIAYLTYYSGSGDSEISSVTAKGKGHMPLTSGSDDYGPVWSPNGKKIAFFRSGGNSDIWTMNADGSNQQNLSVPDLSSQGYVAWSPDGKWLAYEQSGDIWVMRLNGADKTNITDSPDTDTTPTWLPKPRR